MNQADLEKFRQALALSETGAKVQAHKLLRELGQAYPDNGSVLLWQAYTATDLFEARGILDKAANLDPANPDILQAKLWLLEQEKQRLGRRYRQEITGAFVPPIPQELKAAIATAASPIVPPVAVAAATPPVARQPQPAPVSSPDAAAVPAAKPAPSKPAAKTKPAKVKPEKPSVAQTRRFGWRVKALVGVILLLVIAGGLLLIPPVRDTIFDSGPITPAERNFFDAVTEINLSATAQLNTIYNCVVTTNSKACPLENGYKQAYIELGNVYARFQALKSPSKRFEPTYNSFASAYTSLGNTSTFARDSMNQHQMLANQPELLVRLDTGRKLLEQAKADLKNFQQLYAAKK